MEIVSDRPQIAFTGLFGRPPLGVYFSLDRQYGKWLLCLSEQSTHFSFFSIFHWSHIIQGFMRPVFIVILHPLVNSEHTHPEKRPPFRGITTQNTSIFIEKGVRIREIAQVFRSNATQPLSIAF